MSTLALSLTAVGRVDFPLFRAAAAAAAALLALPVPAAWTWTVTAGGGRPPAAGLAVRSLDDDLTAQAVEAAEAALTTTIPWLTWTSGTAGADEPLPVTADVVLAPRPDDDEPADEETAHGPDLLLPFWHGVAAGPTRVRLTVRLLGAGAARAAVLGVVSLSSDSASVLAKASVLAAGLSRTPSELTVAPRRSSAAPLPLSPTRLGRCLASAGLLPGWPGRPVPPPAEIVDRLASTTPPHTALFGGSGLGKTTLLEALVEHRLGAGRTTVVLDPHGDLAARAAVSAAALGRSAVCVDFGDAEQPPLWNLTRPPAGIEPRAWVTDLLGALQAAWPAADEQWFGPVYRRTMYSLLLPLVLDPAGPWPLSRVHELAAPQGPGAAGRFRRSLLSRIGDDGVARDLEEAVRLLDGDREASARTWLLSKLEPLLQHPGMRRVIDTPLSTVDLDAVLAGRSLFLAAPASALGDEGATVISMLAMRWLWHRVRARGCPPGGLDIVLDEAHRMPAALCQEILAEGRKYGVQLRLATQSPALLALPLRTALLTNAGQIAAMRLGPDDAGAVRSSFPDLDTAEFGLLPARQVAIASAGQETVVGSGPAGREPDGGAALRTAHRRQLDAARAELLDRLRGALLARTEDVTRARLQRAHRRFHDHGLSDRRATFRP